MVCFDKTGTLTQNNVATRYMYLDGINYEVGLEAQHLSVNWPLFRTLAEAIIANNTAHLKENEGGSHISIDHLHHQVQ